MLRPYQTEIAKRGLEILRMLHILYLSIEMRVGKTTISLKIAEMIGAKKVLFVTKLKAISSIISDFEREQFAFDLTVINYEQLEKYQPIYDLVIVDEAHSIGKFPKASLRAKTLKKIVGNNHLILLSGTPSPESYSQLFHQFWISNYNPFNLESFYKWAKLFVNVKQKTIKGFQINDYSEARREEIMKVVGKYFISYTQEDAGFIQHEVEEEIQTVNIDPKIKQLIKIVIKDKYYKFKDGSEIICDSAVKQQSKVHQLFSGTVKTEDGSYKILDTSKAEFIKTKYLGSKIAIYYKFIAEGIAIKQLFPNWTDSPSEFNLSTDKIFISQISSGSMGINLATADVLVFYNIDFSSTQYWQARARLQNLDRTTSPKVHWIFAEDGIENKVYDAVLKKKTYTTNYFRRDYINA